MLPSQEFVAATTGAVGTASHSTESSSSVGKPSQFILLLPSTFIVCVKEVVFPQLSVAVHILVIINSVQPSFESFDSSSKSTTIAPSHTSLAVTLGVDGKSSPQVT